MVTKMRVSMMYSKVVQKIRTRFTAFTTIIKAES